MAQQPLVEIYRASNEFQAHLVAHFLQGAGIAAFVDGDILGGAVGAVPGGWSTSPRVLVPWDSVDRARTLLDSAETF